MQLEGCQVKDEVVAVETSMYIYYIRIGVIPGLWYRSFSRSAGMCTGLN